MDKNQKVWESNDVVDFYKRRISEGPQKPEAAILDLLGDISDAALLDIGVGTGRTTAFLSKKVRHYHGIDYSEKMVEECKRIFNGTNLDLEQGDARNLSGFSDSSIDICFFSLNGIDYITDVKEREDSINEIWRILKPGGYFIFSSHNLYNLPLRLKVFLVEKDLRYSVRGFIRSMIFHSVNIFSGNADHSDFMVFNDGTLKFRLKTFYVKPDFQVRQLSLHRFEGIKVFGLDGKEVRDDFERTACDYYLYYLCTKKVI